jgi:hypothetical protein
VVHYSKVEHDRKLKNNGKILTAEQADKMTADWLKLQETLQSIFPVQANLPCDHE